MFREWWLPIAVLAVLGLLIYGILTAGPDGEQATIETPCGSVALEGVGAVRISCEVEDGDVFQGQINRMTRETFRGQAA